MIRKHLHLALFGLSTFIFAFAYWRGASWWVYVEDEPEPILKFELPLYVQVPVSLLVGLLAAGVLVGIVCGVCRLRRGLLSRSR